MEKKEQKFTLNAAIENLDRLSAIGKSLTSEPSEQKPPEPNKLADHINETFEGLNSLTEDTEIVWWYKELIVQTVLFFTEKALKDAFVAGRSQQSFESFIKEWHEINR